jgi:hypothetical protein
MVYAAPRAAATAQAATSSNADAQRIREFMAIFFPYSINEHTARRRKTHP